LLHSQPKESHETKPLPFINSLSKIYSEETKFLSHSLPEVTSQKSFENNLHTIYRMCHEEIEHPRVGELLESLQNGDEEPTISYKCSVTNMKNGLGDRFPSFSTWIEANLEKKCLKFCIRCQKTEA